MWDGEEQKVRGRERVCVCVWWCWWRVVGG